MTAMKTIPTTGTPTTPVPTPTTPVPTPTASVPTPGTPVPTPANRAHLIRAAESVLRANDRGDYSVPTAGLYPVQFNWDSAFAALGYGTTDPDRAWRELESLLSAQWPDGTVPHIAFRGEHAGYFPGPEVWKTGTVSPSVATSGPCIPTSGITQPPVAAIAVRRLHELRGEPNPSQRLDDIIRRIARWHEWFATRRRCPQTGAALVVHPWESGRDNLPDWDAAMARVVPDPAVGEYRRADLAHVSADQRPVRADYDRYLTLVRFGANINWDQKQLGETSPFRMADPLITAVLARAESDLATIAKFRGLNDIADAATVRAEQWRDGFRQLWNPDIRAFVSRDSRDGKFADGITSASFLGPLAGVADDETLRPTLAHFDRIATAVRFALPSCDPDRSGFDRRRYWRGPVWAVVNRLVATGFAAVGESSRAEKLRRDTAALAAASGFCEYYDPQSGDGLGGNNFTWTAAVYLDWAAGDDNDNPKEH